MKTKTSLMTILAAAVFLRITASGGLAQVTAFTYQGRLNEGVNAANGTYDLRFAVYDSSGGPTVIAGPLTNAATGVSNGLFVATLDFGGGVFTGADRWLEIAVRTNGGGTFVALTPRQRLTSSPQAIHAATAGTAGSFSGNLSGDVSGTQGATVIGSVGGYVAAAVASGASTANAATSSAMAGTIVKRDGAGNFAAANITGAFTGSGAGLTNLSMPSASLTGTVTGAQIAPAAIGTAHFNTSNSPVAGQILGFGGSGLAWANNAALGNWSLNGNAGTTPGTHFLGTTDNQPLELKVNGLRALRLEDNGDGSDAGTTPDGAPNVIAGSPSNFVAAGVVGAVIAGGGATRWASQPMPNVSLSDYSTVSGGFGNRIGTAAQQSVVSGGRDNLIGNNSNGAVISGGENNQIAADSGDATIAGGIAGRIGTNAFGSAIGGGVDNSIAGRAEFATVAGGSRNIIDENADLSAIGGGYFNYVLPNSSACAIGGGNLNTIGPSVDASVIGGGNGNRIDSSVLYGTIAGGDNNLIAINASKSFIGGGGYNAIEFNAVLSSIAAGANNMIRAQSEFAFIGGGLSNLIDTNADNSVIAGGNHNTIRVQAYSATIAGGEQNLIHPDAAASTIGGGADNQVRSNAIGATVSGGQQNEVLTGAAYATIPGGRSNSAASYAFAAGRRAKANHTGAFVWADSTDADFATSTSNQFLVRATGGVGVGTGNPAGQLEVSSPGGDAFPQMRLNQANPGDYARLRFTVGGDTSKRWDFACRSNVFVIYSGQTGSEALRLENNNAYVNGALVTTSDRNAKENFKPVDPVTVLEKVVALPLREWNYRTDAERATHLGPMAQDFHAAFGLGTDDKHIATVDADGVALAAIQGLNQKLETELKSKNACIAELERRLERLENLVSKSGGAR